MLRRWLVGGLSVVLLASALLAKPGVVTNRQGETFNGDVTEDDKFVYINGAGGQIKLDKRNIASVVYADTIDDQYAAKHAKLAVNDVKGRMDLAQWANDNNRADLAVAALREARKIDPMNKEAARALDAAQQQLDMDQAAAKTKSVAGATTAPTTATGTAATTQVAAAPPLPRRLLTADEINIIRQKEMQPDDPKVRVRFENNVVKKYLASGDHDAAAFTKLTPEAQALEILSNGDPAMARDVHILTDPAPLLEFKQKVSPIISLGCAASSCHGGTKAGDFALYPGDSTAAVYTNFYILLNYSTTVDGVKFIALDRNTPESSLVLQFGLPRADAKPPHPKVPNLKTIFKTTTDPKYETIDNWLSKSLAVIQPDYGIHVAFSLPGPSTNPSTATTQSLTPIPGVPVTPAHSPEPIHTIPAPNPDPAPKVNPNK